MATTYSFEVPENDGTEDQKAESAKAVINGALTTVWTACRAHGLSDRLVAYNLLHTLGATMKANGATLDMLDAVARVTTGDDENLSLVPAPGKAKGN